MRLFQLLLALGATIALLAGCGEGKDEAAGQDRPLALRFLDVTLDGQPSPENAGVLMAYKNDYFGDVGFGITFYNPVLPSRPTDYIAQGVSDVAISHEPQVALAQAQGAPLVVLGSLVPHPTAAMIWLESSKIDGIAGLKGKTIAFPGVPFQKDLLRALLGRAGLDLGDVELMDVNYNLLPALVDGRADAIFGGSWNVEGAELEARGLQPVIVRAPEMGIPPYDELVVIAREDRLSKNPELFRRFMAAVRRGTAAALENPEAVTDAIAEVGGRRFNRRGTEAAVDATLPLLSRTGKVDRDRAGHLVRWMREEGIVDRGAPAFPIVEP